jgi:DNA repair protein RadD
VIHLRDYQSSLTDKARENIRAKIKRQVLVAPTGAGKTVVAAFIQGGAARRGLVTWFVVHRWEILSKTLETFQSVGIDCGMVADGFPLEPEKTVQLCMVATLANRMHLLPPPDGIVWDEAHHIVAGSHAAIAGASSTAWQIGITATPERLDGRGLRPFFDAMVEGPTPGNLTRNGWLSPYRYFAPGVPDLAAGRGELNRRNVTEIMGDAKLVGQAVDAWGRLAEGKQTINFELSRRSSMATVAAFTTSGIAAVHVDGDMHPDRRAEAFAMFAAGEFKVLSNVAIAGEGVDIPGVECAMLRDPTESLTKFLQEVGRALRPVYAGGVASDDLAQRLAAIEDGPKPFATILDAAGNAFRHGMPDDERSWSLDGRRDRVKETAKRDHVPIRTCPQCYRVLPSTVRICPTSWCGYEYESVWVPPKIVDGELFELGRGGTSDKEQAKEQAKKQRKAEERECGNDLVAWIRLGEARGYAKPKGWALNMMKVRGDYAAKFRRRA